MAARASAAAAQNMVSALCHSLSPLRSLSLAQPIMANMLTT